MTVPMRDSGRGSGVSAGEESCDIGGARMVAASPRRLKGQGSILVFFFSLAAAALLQTLLAELVAAQQVFAVAAAQLADVVLTGAGAKRDDETKRIVQLFAVIGAAQSHACTMLAG